MKQDIVSTVKNFKINSEQLEELELPPKVLDYLSTTGLPAKAPLYVSFLITDGRLPTLNEFANKAGLPTLSDGNLFYRIGTDEGGQLCIEKTTGRVFVVDPNKTIPRRFVNSSIDRFIALLEIYESYSAKIQTLDEADAEELVNKTITDMRKLDPEAFLNVDDWWPSITQQMEFGLL